jgi:hypothetical protein
MNKKYFRKHILLTGLFLINIFLTNAQETNPNLTKEYANSDKKQLLALEYNWLKAEFSLDTAYLSILMDDGFIGITASGTSNKQEELIDYHQTISQRLRDSIIIDSFRLENTIVNLYGTTAVVTFVVHTFRKDKGIPVERKTRFYDVWIKRNGKWKAVASQGTKVAD